MQGQATGEFDVSREMLPSLALGGDVELMHARLRTRFSGPLDAESWVEMLGHMTTTEGSGAYVALERVEGTLDGRSGSFVLQHAGSMERGAPSLVVSVVPDSADGDLSGLRGTMRIDIVDGKHFYGFDYSLPD